MEIPEIKIDVSAAFRDYTNPTNVRSLFYNGLYFNPNRLVKGNSKLHNILIFDLPAVKTCLNCSTCKDKCYAKKAEVQYTDTRIYRDTNFFMYANNSDLLHKLICDQLSKTKITVVRLHSSGDFFSQDYISFWNSIVKQFPSIKFYAYTKVESILDFTEIKANSNFNLISSFVHGNLNFGSLDYCKDLKAKYKSFICPVTSGIKDIKCGKGCVYCVTKNNVCFVEH